MAYLEIIKGHRRRRVEIKEDSLAIGRSPECQLVLDNRAVSRRHAVIRREGSSWVIEDLKSINQTYVNDRPIAEATPLSHRDRLRICHYEFVFYSDEALSNDRYDVQIVLTDPKDDSSVIRQLHESSVSTPSGSKDPRPEQKLPAVQAILRDLSTVAAEDELFSKILDSLFTIFPQAERGYVLLTNDAGKSLTPKAIKSRRSGDDDSLHISKAIVERVLQNGHALLLDDAPQDPEFGKNPSIMNYKIRSIMCVPLASSGNAPLGIIQIHTETARHRFKDEDLDTLVNVATIAAFKLENDRMHRELRAQERMKIEQKYAKDVQMEFLPASCPKLQGYRFDAYYKAAGDVGGDYYDFVVLDEHHVVITLGDVAGKGLAAALLMAHLHSDVRSAAKSCLNPAEAVRSVNRSLCQAGPAEKFVSLVYMVLDTRQHSLSIVNAGHMPPLVRRPDGVVDRLSLDESGPLLKFSPDHHYDTITLPLAPGTTILVYTDGVSDAMNAKQKRFDERLFDTFQNAPSGPEEVLDAIVDAVHKFTGNAPQNDDIAMVCIERDRE